MVTSFSYCAPLIPGALMPISHIPVGMKKISPTPLKNGQLNIPTGLKFASQWGGSMKVFCDRATVRFTSWEYGFKNRKKRPVLVMEKRGEW